MILNGLYSLQNRNYDIYNITNKQIIFEVNNIKKVITIMNYLH